LQHSHSRLAYRKSLRERSWFLVDKLLAGNTAHVIVGDSGSNKTTWIMQTLYDWQQGKPILGNTSHPCSWAYISLDRLTWQTDDTLRRIGLGEWDIPCFSMNELAPNSSVEGFSIETILRHPWLQETKLLVIDGFQVILPDAKAGQSQNKLEMIWMNQLANRLFDLGKAIIGITHSPKTKKGESFSSARSSMLGSVSIGAAADTVITISKVHQPDDNADLDQRIVSFSGKQFKDFSVLYDIDDHGMFTNPQVGAKPAIAIADSFKATVQSSNLDLWLMSLPMQPLKTADMIAYGEAQGIGRSTVYRWIEASVKSKILRKIDHGSYIKCIETMLAPEGAGPGPGPGESIQ
jgi:hypothetical protein